LQTICNEILIYMDSPKERLHTTMVKQLIKTHAPYPAFRSESSHTHTTYICRYIRTECSVTALLANPTDPDRTPFFCDRGQLALDDFHQRKQLLGRPPLQVQVPQHAVSYLILSTTKRELHMIQRRVISIEKNSTLSPKYLEFFQPCETRYFTSREFARYYRLSVTPCFYKKEC
jgi:hypothetical protein